MLRTLTGLMLGIALTAPAFAHNTHGQWPQWDTASTEVQDWASKLKSKEGGLCCSGADGHPAEAEWDMDTGHYRVRIDGEWVDVPDGAVINGPNKFGYAVVWFYRYWAFGADKDKAIPHIRCFIPGAGM